MISGKYTLSFLFVIALLAAPLPGWPGRAMAQNRATKTSAASPVPLKQTVDSIVVLKKQHRMYLYSNRKLLKEYSICLGTSPVGPKHFQNDRKTPEGQYRINGKNPNSIAHKSIGISYPNDNDRRYARAAGKPTGGDIKIHGLLNGEEANRDAWMDHDWTWGCIALNNEDLDELYEHIAVGAPIKICP